MLPDYLMKFEKLIRLCKWLKIFDKPKPPDAKLANGGFALAKIFNPNLQKTVDESAETC